MTPSALYRREKRKAEHKRRAKLKEVVRLSRIRAAKRKQGGPQPRNWL